MSVVATGIVVLGLIYIGIMLPRGKLTSLSAFGFMACVVAGVLVVAVVVPNASSISHLIVKAGQYFSLSLDMARQARQVHEDTAENRQINSRFKYWRTASPRVRETLRLCAIMSRRPIKRCLRLLSLSGIRGMSSLFRHQGSLLNLIAASPISEILLTAVAMRVSPQFTTLIKRSPAS